MDEGSRLATLLAFRDTTLTFVFLDLVVLAFKNAGSFTVVIFAAVIMGAAIFILSSLGSIGSTIGKLSIASTYSLDIGSRFLTLSISSICASKGMFTFPSTGLNALSLILV